MKTRNLKMPGEVDIDLEANRRALNQDIEKIKEMNKFNPKNEIISDDKILEVLNRSEDHDSESNSGSLEFPHVRSSNLNQDSIDKNSINVSNPENWPDGDKTSKEEGLNESKETKWNPEDGKLTQPENDNSAKQKKSKEDSNEDSTETGTWLNPDTEKFTDPGRDE